MSTKKLVNHVAVVLDSSGSMDAYRDAVVGSFNSSVEAIRTGALREKQITDVSFYTFGEAGYNVRTRFVTKPVSALVPLEKYDYRPSGMTALLDAVGTAIEDLKRLPDANSKDTSFLILVKTDGEENNSNRYTRWDLSDLIRSVQATDRWSIAFLVPPGCKQRVCKNLNLNEGNVREWEGSTRGVVEAARATVQGVDSYFVSRSSGQGATKSFYADLNNVKPSQVKKALDDVSPSVSVWNVPKEEAIAPFAERRSRKPYRTGCAFYQLTKAELIQENKQLLVMEKGKPAVWAGEDARRVLGIPEGRVKIKPGNFANYDIFVQSTSNNRKLVRGTKLVYCKSGVSL